MGELEKRIIDPERPSGQDTVYCVERAGVIDGMHRVKAMQELATTHGEFANKYIPCQVYSRDLPDDIVAVMAQRKLP